jgi:O-antigen/teichoic acid export membrane protein
MAMGLLTKSFWGVRVLGLKECFVPAFAVMLMTVPAGSLMSYFSILTRFKKKHVQFSIGTVLQLFIQIGLSVIGVVVIGAGIISVFIGLLAGELFAILYFAYLNREYLCWYFDNTLLYRALVFALPTLPAILAGWLDSSVGQILIGRFVSLDDLGVYSIALSLASVFTLISSALSNVWTPFLFENYKNNCFETDFRKLFTIMAWIIILVTLMLSLYSREIVLLLSNESYLDAGNYFTLLCIPMGVYLLFPFASSGVSITRETRYIGISYVVGSIGNIVLLFATLRFWGIIAVPISLAVSRLITYFSLYKVSENRMGYSLPNYLLIILISVSIISYLILSVHCSIVIRTCIVLLALAFFLNFVNHKYNLTTIVNFLKNKEKQ